jgi:hypothetical protein
LRFALSHSEEFQAYKQSRGKHPEPAPSSAASSKPERPKDRQLSPANVNAVSEVAK